jgi:hypothetical protein
MTRKSKTFGIMKTDGSVVAILGERLRFGKEVVYIVKSTKSTSWRLGLCFDDNDLVWVDKAVHPNTKCLYVSANRIELMPQLNTKLGSLW